MSNLPPVDQNAIAVTAIAQNMINGTPVALAGAHWTPAQVKKYVDNVKVQLRTSIFSAASMDSLIDEAAWRTISMKVANSCTLKENPARDWRREWSTATWLEALEEVYAIDDTSRFANNSQIWTDWTFNLRTRLEVDAKDMGKLSKVFTEAIVDKDVLHPISEDKMHKILSDLAHAFIASGNPNRQGQGNQNFYAEFMDLLKHDEEYKAKVILCERVIVKWQREAFQVSQRGNKRKEDSNPAAALVKKPRAEQTP